MSDLNVVALVGRLSRDCVVKTSAKGESYALFWIAVDRSRKNDEGAWEEAPSFFMFSLYGERASRLAPYLVKGQAVSVQGYLVLDKWESQGVPHTRLDVLIDELRLIGPAPGGAKGKKDFSGDAAGEGGESPEMVSGEESETDPDLDLGETGLTGESLI